MNNELVNQYSILANTGFKIVTKDGEDLTEDLKKVTNILYEKEEMING